MSRHFLVRFLSPFLILSLSLPPCAWALRQTIERKVESLIAAGLEEPLPRIKDSSDFISVVQGEYSFTSAESPSPMIASKFANPCVICVLDARAKGITAVTHADRLIRYPAAIQGIFDEFLLYDVSEREIEVDIYGIQAEDPGSLAGRLKGLFELVGIPSAKIRVHLLGEEGHSRSIVVDARDGRRYELEEPEWTRWEQERVVDVSIRRYEQGDPRLVRHVDPRGLLPSAGAEEADKKEPAVQKLDPVVAGRLLRRDRARRRWIGYQRQLKRRAEMSAAVGLFRGDSPWLKPKEKPKLPRELEPAEKLWFRFDPKKWPDLVRKSIDVLKRDGIVHIPLEGGEAVLLGRLSQDRNKYLLLDLLLKPDGSSAIVAGRIDLFYEDPRGYVAKGAPLFAVPFSQEALRTIETVGVYDGKGASPFQNLRSTFKQRALHISEDALEVSGVSREVLQSAMTLVAVELLGYLGHPAWEVDPSYDNQFLAALTSSALPTPPSGTQVLSAPLSNVKTILRKRLSTAAGLEEDEAVLQAVLADEDHWDALERGDPVTFRSPAGTDILVMQVPAEIPSASRVYLQEGLQVGFPVGTEVVPLGAGLEEVLAVWQRQLPGPADTVFFNVEHTPEGPLLHAWLPLVSPLPAVLRGRRETVAAMARDTLLFVAQIARRLGYVLDLETTRITFLQVGPTTYAILRAA